MTSIETLRAVHHPTRRRILEHLHLHDACQVGGLASALEAQVGSISHHLRVLERVGLVERAPELAVDGRTSWWRSRRATVSWAVDDFDDSPADQVQARAAERLSVEYQLAKLTAFRRDADRWGEQWRRAAFGTDSVAVASPDELQDLQRRLGETYAAWRDEIDVADGRDRRPVFWFSHAFPTRP